jgi:hypothetical protein
MGCNTSPAWIQFPVRFLDEELRKCLEEHEDVEFTEDGQPVAHDDPEDLSATIVDLVTDLLHLAHQNDIEPDYVLRVAGGHQHTEVEEEAMDQLCEAKAVVGLAKEGKL